LIALNDPMFMDTFSCPRLTAIHQRSFNFFAALEAKNSDSDILCPEWPIRWGFGCHQPLARLLLE